MQSLDELVGASHVVPRVRGVLESGKWPRGFVLRGPTGTGKTTLASFLARAYVCQAPGPKGDPCGRCESCRDVLDGEFRRNVTRINGDVESSKDIVLSALAALRMPSLYGDRRVLWIEEAGFLSEAAKGALHTFLEEPSQTLVVMTSMHANLPKSLLDRCQTFNLKLPSPADKLVFLKKHLEGDAPEVFWRDVAPEVIHRTGGSYRELLRLVETIRATGDYSKAAVTSAILDAEGQVEAADLLDGLLRKDWSTFDRIRKDSAFVSDKGYLVGYLLVTGLSYLGRSAEGLPLWEERVVRLVAAQATRAVQLAKVFESVARAGGGKGWDRFLFLKNLLAYMLE